MDYKKALEYATAKHARQMRIGGSEYITHPVAVARILGDKGFGIDVQVMGLFHDLLEDTDASEDEIIALSNKEVFEVVKLLTKEKNYKMDEYIGRIFDNEKASAVKLADRIHNLQCAVVAGKAFQKKYLAESQNYYMELAERSFYMNGKSSELFQSDFLDALDGLDRIL